MPLPIIPSILTTDPRTVYRLGPTLAVDADVLEWIAPLGAYPQSLPVTLRR